MRVLVCGGRYYADRPRLFAALDQIHAASPIAVIIAGGATGADALAEAWAEARGVRKAIFPADWRRYGRAAGPYRNRVMLTQGRPDLVLAFPGSFGTRDMVRQAKTAGVRVQWAE